jgi:hypothetical protein
VPPIEVSGKGNLGCSTRKSCNMIFVIELGVCR